MHKPVQRRYTTNPTVANSIHHQWTADLADMKNLSRYNKGIKYLLTVVDVLSKYAWVVPMKDKTGAEQKRAFESILKKGRKPLRLQTDKGSEFYNKPFQEYFKQKKITHFNTQSDTKASVVERFNKTGVAPTGVVPKNVTMYNDVKMWKKLYSKKLFGVPSKN